MRRVLGRLEMKGTQRCNAEFSTRVRSLFPRTKAARMYCAISKSKNWGRSSTSSCAGDRSSQAPDCEIADFLVGSCWVPLRLSELTRTHVPIQQTSPPADQTADTQRSGATADCAIFPWRAPSSQPLQSRRAARHRDMFEKYRTCDPCRFPQRSVYDVITRRVFSVGSENCSEQHTMSRRVCSMFTICVPLDRCFGRAS